MTGGKAPLIIIRVMPMLRPRVVHGSMHAFVKAAVLHLLSSSLLHSVPFDCHC